MRQVLILLMAMVALFQSACSQKYKDVNATIRAGILGAPDVALSVSELEAFPYPCLYAQLNDEPQVFMVLAYADRNHQTGHMRYKWMSADRAVLVTEQGRIVKTIGLYNDNLVGYQRQALAPAHWQVRYDWMPDYRYAYMADVHLSAEQAELLTTPLVQYQTQKYRERVSFAALERSFDNYYWIDKASGEVVQSLEYLGPNMGQIRLTMVKTPY